jgi:hypothetical protein
MADNAIGFVLGEYNTDYELIIDPTLVYSSFIGADATEESVSMAVDNSANAYVCGSTVSANFPVTAGGYDVQLNGTGTSSIYSDAFVTKLDPTGSTNLYTTFIGGDSYEQAFSIQVDASNQAYIVGMTYSNNFPTNGTVAALQPTYGGAGDAFIFKLNAAGSSDLYSTYFGGVNEDMAIKIRLTSTNQVCMTGYTY